MVALFCMVTLLRHDAKALWIVLGANLNVGLSITLKRILNQERPSTSKSDPGMPSSHAQSIFFIVFIVNLSSNYRPPLFKLRLFLGTAISKKNMLVLQGPSHMICRWVPHSCER